MSSPTIPLKPCSLVCELYDLETIDQVRIEYIGMENAETWVTLSNYRFDPKKPRSIRKRLHAVRPFLETEPDFLSVYRLKPHLVNQVKAWRIYEKENAKELAEYERLKRKFGAGA